VRREYARHLPHQVPEDMPLFLTWNLKGAMPRSVRDQLEREMESLDRQPAKIGESPRDRALRHGKLMFAKADEYLDRTDQGPLHLQDAAAAKIVEHAILFGAAERYKLFAWCIMANHVHVLLTPIWELAKVTQGLKGFTAREVNRLQDEVGRTLWMDESYDHWARDEEELLRIIVYIENNPVKAGLCEKPEDWPSSSARFRRRWHRGRMVMPDWVNQCGLAEPT